MMEILYSTGMRNSELRNLKMEDVKFDTGEVVIRKGKGDKDRVVPIGTTAMVFLEEYIARSRPRLLKDNETDHIFFNFFGQRFSRRAPADIIRKYVNKLGMNKIIRTHTFRHTCATHLLRNGADVRHIQQFLGHNSIDTTARYLHLDITDLKKVHSKTHPREKM